MLVKGIKKLVEGIEMAKGERIEMATCQVGL